METTSTELPEMETKLSSEPPEIETKHQMWKQLPHNYPRQNQNLFITTTRDGNKPDMETISTEPPEMETKLFHKNHQDGDKSQDMETTEPPEMETKLFHQNHQR